ncbi:MAG: hypothetical protein KJP02_03870 [Octadecabacter sp.]|nr:hypothetical protein [Octadecabacter sp.]
MSDLQRLSDAVWDISTAPAQDQATFEQIVQEAFHSAIFEGPPLHSKIRDIMVAQEIPQTSHPTGPQRPPESGGLAEYHAAYFPDCSPASSSTSPYRTGFLAADCNVRDGQSCIAIALPSKAALPDLNTNQATFSLGSAPYP